MVTFRTPEEDRQRLREEAAKRGTTVTGLIRDALAKEGVPIRCS